jgi:SAM-dependent methyltransferase|tara:strand:- start:6352 stop:7002 length:651 start_codon:yes stop_codon:yes gene_type:complete
MKNGFDRIKRMYEESYSLNGDSPASLLTPKGRNDFRFRAINSLVTRPGVRVLDYGCGLGYLYDFLLKSGSKVCYTGVDMIPEFVNVCRTKHPEVDFRQIEPDSIIKGNFDVVFASGVFNIRTHANPRDSRKFALERIETLYKLSGEALVCDFLSSFVDFQHPDAQHFSAGEIAEFCAQRLGRRFQLRHDLLPYEMTLVAWKKSEIKRPENFFEADL